MAFNFKNITCQINGENQKYESISFLASWVKAGGRIDDYEGFSSWVKTCFGISEETSKEIFDTLIRYAKDDLVESAKINREEQNRELRNKKMAAAAVLGLNPMMTYAVVEGNEDLATLAAISYYHK